MLPPTSNPSTAAIPGIASGQGMYPRLSLACLAIDSALAGECLLLDYIASDLCVLLIRFVNNVKVFTRQHALPT